MTLEELRQALITRVVTWPDAPIAFDNLPTPDEVEAAQATGSPWVEIQIQDGAGILRNLNDDVARTGLLAIRVHAAINGGTRQAREIASSLCAHLEHYRAGTLRLRQANPGRVGQQDGYYQLTLNIPFVAD